ncbi:MAG: hypothetical protein HQ503_09960 [Rhodospirillales bacterium]|nr:hypothetical protein [Rhodospirillales bacterium]
MGGDPRGRKNLGNLYGNGLKYGHGEERNTDNNQRNSDGVYSVHFIALEILCSQNMSFVEVNYKKRGPEIYLGKTAY